VVRYVVTTRLRHPDRTPAAIAAELAALGHTVSVRSVERTLTQFGLTRPRHAPALVEPPAAAAAVALPADPLAAHAAPPSKEVSK
jgi:hypothetical protein